VQPDEPIDVVIPVYNAPELTRRCLTSLYRALPAQLGAVHVHDNASGAETRAMLAALDLPRLHVHHAPHNSGFGDGVNQGFARTRSPWVLVLNSDVEARSDFLSPLRAALAADAQLAVVTPAGNTFRGYDLNRYALRAGCVVTHNLYAYAFLIRRAAFEAAGRFDPAFGLGFFEDTDLSRKLIRAGHWLGIHPRSELHHEIHGSFEAMPAFRDGMAANRELYLSRYPEARRQLLIASRAAPLSALDTAAGGALSAVLREGGGAHWLARSAAEPLPALEVRGERLALRGLARALRRHRHKAHRRFSELWLAADLPTWLRAAFGAWARAQAIPVRRL
jgi:N-acetylglucosaminyl-diphospho-decaprenol L-rhamnosyltransferase